MKLSKFTKIILLFSIAMLALVLLFPLVTKMSSAYTDDSGFDSSYDSGGSWDSGPSGGSGSDWDSSSSSDSGNYSYIGTFGLVVVLIHLLTVTVSFIIQIQAFAAISGRDKKDTLIVLVCVFLTFIPIINIMTIAVGCIIIEKYNNLKSINMITNENVTEALAKYGFSPNVIVQQAFASYKRIQIAWMRGDVEPVRDILSDEIYNMYKTQLMTLAAKHQKNMMEEITFKGGSVTDVIEQKDDVAIVINMKVTCRDYIINTKSNQVVRGDMNRTCIYNYSLTFTFNKNDAKVITNCPGCNAKLPIEGKSIKCEYCGTTIKRESTNLVMTKKTMISQN